MKASPIDPFAIKRRSKLHPYRLFFTTYARSQDWISRRRFHRYVIPMTHSATEPTKSVLSFDTEDTAVTPIQMEAILQGIQETENLKEPLVEVGAYRGVTTQIMGNATRRRLFAIDPFLGYGGAETDCTAFRSRTQALPNVTHLRATSGAASADQGLERISFAFIDAVHDYVNARFDGLTWSRKLVQDGLIAFHDTDSECFAGVTRTVWELLNRSRGELTLHTHVPGLVILKRE